MGVLMMIFKILAAIFVFGIIILVHELGHFLMCKLMGVRVNEFAIGMGPKLLSFGKKETAYTLRLFPIGGFCAMEGEDEGAPTPALSAATPTGRRRTAANQPFRTRRKPLPSRIPAPSPTKRCGGASSSWWRARP